MYCEGNFDRGKHDFEVENLFLTRSFQSFKLVKSLLGSADGGERNGMGNGLSNKISFVSIRKRFTDGFPFPSFDITFV